MKYVVVVYNIPVYDKWRREYASIPIAGVYPLEIMMSGYYTVEESDLNKSPLLTDYLLNSHFPTTNIETKRKVVRTDSRGDYPNVVFDFQGGFEYAFYSTPLGGSAVNWLWSKLPKIGALSITFGYSSASQSVTTYKIDIDQGAPNQLYYVLMFKRNLELIDSNNVEVTMYFTAIDDG
ncbi:hypothetical protein [Pyrococcus sp.]|uniref:hypothetical protein n=1 Tax=Pyrococcus sp. TaxID=33866 RepID=UPI00258E012F|nr:hypothetical protein [Pyrococcus sp.]